MALGITGRPGLAGLSGLGGPRAVTGPRALLLLDDVPSTQDVALALARDGSPHGTVVVAETQTAGRGRQGAAWADVPGRSLLCSQILRPERGLQELPTLSLVAGIAVAEAVGGLGVEARLKWPNDVLVDGRKLAGILAELHEPGRLVILGIGINVHPVPPLDDEGGAAAASLDEGDHPVDRLTVLRLVLERFDEVYAVWSADGLPALVERYAAVDALAGKEVEGTGAGGGIRGTALGVDGDGALIVESAGERRTIASGAVRRIRPTR